MSYDRSLDLAVIDFAKHPEAALDAIVEAHSPVIVSRLYSFDLAPIRHVIDSGKEHKNGSWLNFTATEADAILRVAHEDAALLERSLFRGIERGAYDKLGHRLWRQFTGCMTQMHFDAGFISILNTQMVGRKKWLLVSPTAAVRMGPIGIGHNIRHVASVPLGEMAPGQLFTAETRAGDTLFIPEFWYHQVWTLEDSVNLDTYMRRSLKALPFTPTFRQMLGASFFGKSLRPELLELAKAEGAADAAMCRAQWLAHRALRALQFVPRLLDRSEA